MEFPHLFWPKNVLRQRSESRNLGALLSLGPTVSGSRAESFALVVGHFSMQKGADPGCPPGLGNIEGGGVANL